MKVPCRQSVDCYFLNIGICIQSQSAFVSVYPENQIFNQIIRYVVQALFSVKPISW